MSVRITKGAVQTVQEIYFTGSHILAWGKKIPATCEVRNEVNGERKPWQVVYTMGSTRPHDLPYQPRPFPPGVHEITDVADMQLDSVYWPMWIGTDATLELPEWDLDDEDMYRRPTNRIITGRGYGLHHARYRKGSRLVPSRTTLGCINILDPDDAEWLGEELRKAFGNRLHVVLNVPEWDKWGE